MKPAQPLLAQWVCIILYNINSAKYKLCILIAFLNFPKNFIDTKHRSHSVYAKQTISSDFYCNTKYQHFQTTSFKHKPKFHSFHTSQIRPYTTINFKIILKSIVLTSLWIKDKYISFPYLWNNTNNPREYQTPFIPNRDRNWTLKQRKHDQRTSLELLIYGKTWIKLRWHMQVKISRI